MTKRERVRAAIAHQSPDKIPTFFHLAPDGLDKYGESLMERYGKPDMKRLRGEGKIDYRLFRSDPPAPAGETARRGA